MYICTEITIIMFIQSFGTSALNSQDVWYYTIFCQICILHSCLSGLHIMPFSVCVPYYVFFCQGCMLCSLQLGLHIMQHLTKLCITQPFVRFAYYAALCHVCFSNSLVLFFFYSYWYLAGQFTGMYVIIESTIIISP